MNEIKEYKFGTSDLVVPIRSDGMIDATALCKAANKKLNDYIRLKTTQHYLEVLKSDTGIPVSQLITIQKGNSKLFTQGTWVHRKVGYHLAQWISPAFAVQVSNILDELFITGKVQLGNEKSNEELESQYKEKIEQLSSELETTKTNYRTLSIKNNSFMKKHHYVKFKESGPCFYIVDPGVKCECVHNTPRKKFGVAGISSKNEQIDTIDRRLKSHRTTWPLLKVEFILFTKHAVIIEKNFKIMYENEINPNGHEIIEGVPSNVMIKKVKELLAFLSIKDFCIIPGEKLLEYNNYVDTTVKTKVVENEEAIVYKRLMYYSINPIIIKFYKDEFISLHDQLAGCTRIDENHPSIPVIKMYIDELNEFYKRTSVLSTIGDILGSIKCLSTCIRDHLYKFLFLSENNTAV